MQQSPRSVGLRQPQPATQASDYLPYQNNPQQQSPRAPGEYEPQRPLTGQSSRGGDPPQFVEINGQRYYLYPEPPSGNTGQTAVGGYSQQTTQQRQPTQQANTAVTQKEWTVGGAGGYQKGGQHQQQQIRQAASQKSPSSGGGYQEGYQRGAQPQQSPLQAGAQQQQQQVRQAASQKSPSSGSGGGYQQEYQRYEQREAQPKQSPPQGAGAQQQQRQQVRPVTNQISPPSGGGYQSEYQRYDQRGPPAQQSPPQAAQQPRQQTTQHYQQSGQQQKQLGSQVPPTSGGGYQSEYQRYDQRSAQPQQSPPQARAQQRQQTTQHYQQSGQQEQKQVGSQVSPASGGGYQQEYQRGAPAQQSPQAVAPQRQQTTQHYQQSGQQQQQQVRQAPSQMSPPSGGGYQHEYQQYGQRGAQPQQSPPQAVAQQQQQTTQNYQQDLQQQRQQQPQTKQPSAQTQLQQSAGLQQGGLASPSPQSNENWKHFTQWSKVKSPEPNYFYDGLIPSGPPPTFTNAPSPGHTDVEHQQMDYSDHYARLRDRRRAESAQARRHQSPVGEAAEVGYRFGGLDFTDREALPSDNFLSEAELTELRRSRRDWRYELPVRRPTDYYALDYGISAPPLQRSRSVTDDPDYQGYQAQKPRKHWKYEASLEIPVNNFEVEVVECVDPVRLIGDTLSNMKPPIEQELTEEEKQAYGLFYTPPEGFKHAHMTVPRSIIEPSSEPICFSVSAKKELAAGGGQSSTPGAQGMKQYQQPNPLSDADSSWYTAGPGGVNQPTWEGVDGNHPVQMPDWIVNKRPPPQQPPYWAVQTDETGWNAAYQAKGQAYQSQSQQQGQQPMGFKNAGIREQSYQQQQLQQQAPSGSYRAGGAGSTTAHQQSVRSIRPEEAWNGRGQPQRQGGNYQIVVESAEIVDGEQI